MFARNVVTWNKYNNMKITKVSTLSGLTHTRDLNVTEEQIKRWENGELAQRAFPDLSPDDREFLITGSTPEEWADMFPEHDSEEEQFN